MLSETISLKIKNNKLRTSKRSLSELLSWEYALTVALSICGLTYRSSHRSCSIKKAVLKNSEENSCVGVSFLIKLQIWRSATLLKSDSYLPKKFALFDSLKALLKWWKVLFYFIVKALFVLKVFKFLSWLFGHVEKTAW